MKKIINFIFIGVISGVLLGGCDGQSSIEDPNATHFVKFYGRDGNQAGVDLVTLPDGSVILFGTSTPSGQGATSQWYLVKADAKGTVIWEKEFGVDGVNETASDIELTADNRLVAVGNSYISEDNKDVLIKTFSLDGVELKSNLRQTPNAVEEVISVTVTSDGFIVAGSTNNVFLKGTLTPPTSDLKDGLHLRFDNNLVEFGSVWLQTSGYEGIDVIVKVVDAGAGIFYAFGYTNAYIGNTHVRPDYNYWYFRIKDPGVQDGVIFYGPNDDEKLGSVAVVSTGFLLSGVTYNQSGNADFFVSRLRRTLEIPLGSGDSFAFSPKPLSIALGLTVPEKTSACGAMGGGFFIIGNERTSIDNQNWVLLKITEEGTLAWKSPIVFGGEGEDTIGTIKELPDGRLLIIGTMKTGKPDGGETKMTLIKVDSEGKLND